MKSLDSQNYLLSTSGLRRNLVSLPATNLKINSSLPSMGGFKFKFDKFSRNILSKKSWFGHHATSNTSVYPKSPDNVPSTSFDRFEPCYVLWKNEVSVVVWLEDLLVLHGSKIPVWDLTLLVQDPQEAAGILCGAGYKENSMQTRFEDEPEFVDRSVRMTHSSTETGVVLLPAQDWYYDLNEDVDDFLPPLNAFLDSMFEFWLSISSQDYVDRIRFAMYISRLINYCYNLTTLDGHPVKDPAYAKKLRPEHREIHYDIVSDDPKAESFTITKRHEYHVRRGKEIKDGVFSPQPYKKGVFRPELAILSE